MTTKYRIKIFHIDEIFTSVNDQNGITDLMIV